jgi:hypothetical protein
VQFSLIEHVDESQDVVETVIGDEISIQRFAYELFRMNFVNQVFQCSLSQVLW